MMMDVEQIAAKCEAADGPDRALDAAIIVALDWKWDDWEEGELTAKTVADKHGIEWLIDRMVNGHASIWRNLPYYTASVDAAMTLVPEGWVSIHAWLFPHRTDYAIFMDEDGDVLHRGRGKTPALALCAAALKARAHLEQTARILARAKSEPANAAALEKLAGEVASIREVGDVAIQT